MMNKTIILAVAIMSHNVLASAASPLNDSEQFFSVGNLPAAPADYFQLVSHQQDEFIDAFNFTVASDTVFSTVNSLSVANAVPDSTNPFSSHISNLSYFINQGSLIVATYSGGLARSVTILPPGNYFLEVMGVADGTHGGSYAVDLAAASATAEPATYAMLLGGLGVIGFSVRSRKEARVG